MQALLLQQPPLHVASPYSVQVRAWYGCRMQVLARELRSDAAVINFIAAMLFDAATGLHSPYLQVAWTTAQGQVQVQDAGKGKGKGEYQPHKCANVATPGHS